MPTFPEQNRILGQILVKTGRLSPRQVSAALDGEGEAPLAKLLVDAQQIRPESAPDIQQHQLRLAEGQILLGLAAISQGQLDAAMVAAEGSQTLAAVLVRQGVLPAPAARQLAETHAALLWNQARLQGADPAFDDLVPRGMAERYKLIPVARIGDRLVVATPRPNDVNALDDLRIATGLRAVTVPVTDDEYDGFARGGRPPRRPVAGRGAEVEVQEEPSDIEDLAGQEVEAPIVRLVNDVLSGAIADGASDVHVEPKERILLIRYRKDGLLSDVMRIPKASQQPVAARIKIMANLDVSERRLPQDGKVRVKVQNTLVDLRVSTMPSQYGEKIVIRVLNTAASLRPISDLGLNARQQEDLVRLLKSPQGILFVTGPTGSGKTTTLYSALGHLQSRAKNIITIEDPIEYNFENATQVQVNPTIDLSFARVLRSVLRQDPDIVLIGETRDHETAKIAVEAAMTGHMVLTSLHANDATSTISRLEEMGVQPYLIGSALLGCIAQRLIRLICGECVEDYRAAPEILADLGLAEDAPLYRGAGCEHCHGTGYQGRRAIYEVFAVSGEARELILKRAPSNALRLQAQKDGMMTMRQHAIDLVRQGLTTFEEFVRVVYSEAGHDRFCPRCKNVVEAEFATCPYCKYQLNPTCPACQFNVKSEWSVCPKCGEALVADKRVCRSCMAEIDPVWIRCPFCYFEDHV